MLQYLQNTYDSNGIYIHWHSACMPFLALMYMVAALMAVFRVLQGESTLHSSTPQENSAYTAVAASSSEDSDAVPPRPSSHGHSAEGMHSQSKWKSLTGLLC